MCIKRPQVWNGNNLAAALRTLPAASVLWCCSQFTSPRQTRHRLNCFVVSGLVWRCELSRPDRCVLCLVCVGSVRRHNATAGRTPTQLSSGQFTPLHQTRQDCRACLSTAAATGQAGSCAAKAVSSRTTAHTQRRCTPRKCKHAVDYCIRLNLNFFTIRHSTRVIYRLTVQTLPDGLETHSHRLTRQTGPSCHVWRAVWIGHY